MPFVSLMMRSVLSLVLLFLTGSLMAQVVWTDPHSHPLTTR